MTENIQQEFLKHIGQRGVKAANIVYCAKDGSNSTFNLYENYTPSEWNNFLNDIYFPGDDAHLYVTGHIWFNDGTFSQRLAINSNESWHHCTIPIAPRRPCPNERSSFTCCNMNGSCCKRMFPNSIYNNVEKESDQEAAARIQRDFEGLCDPNNVERVLSEIEKEKEK